MLVEIELRDALGQEGCPLCRLEQIAEQRYWTWFVLENYYSEPTLEQLVRGGFCQLHAWRATRVAEKRLSATYDVVVREAEQRLLAVRKALEGTDGRPFSRLARRRWKQTLSDTLQRREPCPVCATSARSVEASGRCLIKLLAEEPGRDAYAGSDGLCWNHLVHLLPATSPATAAFLLDDFLRRLSSIQKSLAEYFHKCDYRYSHEPKGAEQTAYLRAVEIFSGPPEKVLLSEPR